MTRKVYPEFISFFLMCLFSVGLIISCRPDREEVNPTLVTQVTATVQGQVLFAGSPLGGAAVSTVGGASVQTDANGNFTLQDVQINPNAGYVKVEKQGFFVGSRTFLATNGIIPRLSIELIPKEITGSFEAASGGTITASGCSVALPASAVVRENGSAYTGKVSVASYYLDPTGPRINAIMPGDLRGITTEGRERGLKSFSMMAVELIGENGEKLQIATGKSATLTFPIPARLQQEAPATIPLWYFDEATGLWREQGMATKQGTTYVGTVSHFSFWSSNASFELVSFQAVLKDAAGQPLPHTEVTFNFREVNGILSRITGRTDAVGRISSRLPANMPLEMSLIASLCSQSVFTKAIGPFTGATDLGVITTTANNTDMKPIVTR